MSLPAFQNFEKQIGKKIRFFEEKKGVIGKKIERRIREFDEKRDELGKKITRHLREFEQKRDDDFRFLRNWIEKPLAMGAVAPSGRVLARTMARYVDTTGDGPIIELGPGTGPVTEALIKNGVDPKRLVLVEFDPSFCRLLQELLAPFIRQRRPRRLRRPGGRHRFQHLLARGLRHQADGFTGGWIP